MENNGKLRHPALTKRTSITSSAYSHPSFVNAADELPPAASLNGYLGIKLINTPISHISR